MPGVRCRRHSPVLSGQSAGLGLLRSARSRRVSRTSPYTPPALRQVISSVGHPSAIAFSGMARVGPGGRALSGLAMACLQRMGQAERWLDMRSCRDDRFGRPAAREDLIMPEALPAE
jgi:hypothetical protein